MKSCESFAVNANLTRPAGLEPATLGLEGRCSIQLSYGRINLKIKNQDHAAFFRGRGI